MRVIDYLKRQWISVTLATIGLGSALVAHFVMVAPEFSEIQWASMLLFSGWTLTTGLIILIIKDSQYSQEKRKDD